jgi:two-component system osmolarity sensor histidine kinase EnvZ
MIGRFLKPFAPRTLYGRAAAILLLPMLTLQLAVAAVFVQRHFEDVTAQMTNNLLLEVELVLRALERQPFDEVQQGVAEELKIELRSWDGVPSGNRMVFYDISGRTIVPLMRSRLDGLLEIDLSDLDFVLLGLMSPKGLVQLKLERDRVSASNPHQVLVLMVFTGIFMTLIAYVFLRNQLRPIKRLSVASAAFGRGQRVELTPSGALEVRAAGQAFLDMRDRIERQIEQRTMMLSGVSHDLRTPITRLQLALELMEGPEVEDLKKDVAAMQMMVDSFLNYARDLAADPVEDVDLVALCAQLAARMTPPAGFELVGAPRLCALRPVPIGRAIENLLVNAGRYGSQIILALHFEETGLRIAVHDDGPGIPEAQRAAAAKPFVRLEAARGQNQGGGVGLGLAIAADVARSHGGQLVLGAVPSWVDYRRKFVCHSDILI